MNIQCGTCGAAIAEGVKFCPQCGSAVEAREEQRGAAKKTASSRRNWFPYLLAAVVLTVGLVTFLSQLLRTYHPVIEKQPSVAVPAMYRGERISSVSVQARMEGGYIVIPLAEVLANKLVRFEDPEGKAIAPIIAYISPNGKLVTAMSLSEHCRSTDFYLKGDNIHCASCPSYWNMSSLEAYACCQKYYPDPIPSIVSGDLVRIDPQVVRGWRSRM